MVTEENMSLSTQAASPVAPSTYWPTPSRATTPPASTMRNTSCSARSQLSTAFSTTKAKAMKKTISRPGNRLCRGVTEVAVAARYTAAYSRIYRLTGE